MIVSYADSKIRIGAASIPFQVKRGRPNRIRISFREDDILWIETGNGSLEQKDEAFLLSKSNWILKTYSLKRVQTEERNGFLDSLEEKVPIAGQLTPVEFLIGRSTRFKLKPGSHFQIYGPRHLIQNHRRKMLYYSLRKFAEQYLHERVMRWKNTCQVDFNRLKVKDVKSKWGSCSSLRNINLNWHLVLLDDDLIDYVIVHELMHLHEMNHSPRFWALVGKFCPNYKVLRQKLKEKSWLVGILK